MPQFQDLRMQKNSPYLFLEKYGLFDQKVRSFCAKGTVYFLHSQRIVHNPLLILRKRHTVVLSGTVSSMPRPAKRLKESRLLT